jgi:anti-sigma-K factor RskA
MSELGIDTTTSEELSAYHDGELRGLARWRLERRLRREPGLRRELAGLVRMGEFVRAGEAATQPDLWDRIEQRLPAVDARRADEQATSGLGGSAWWRPLGAATAAAALALAVYVGFSEAPQAPGGAVRWMDSGGRSVLVVDDAESDVTIIWLLEDAVEGAARGGSGEVA